MNEQFRVAHKLGLMFLNETPLPEDVKAWAISQLHTKSPALGIKKVKHYPKAKSFYDNPEEWMNKYGDSGTEIYFGWEFTQVYNRQSIVVDVIGYHPEDDETRYVYDFEEMANDFDNQLNRLMQRTTDKI